MTKGEPWSKMSITPKTSEPPSSASWVSPAICTSMLPMVAPCDSTPVESSMNGVDSLFVSLQSNKNARSMIQYRQGVFCSLLTDADSIMASDQNQLFGRLLSLWRLSPWYLIGDIFEEYCRLLCSLLLEVSLAQDRFRSMVA